MRIDEIVNKVFTRSFMGYDIEQVDVFLDEVIETLERYEAEKREMLSAMEYLMKKLEHGQKMPLSDMKKAIDSGRSQAKPSLPAGSETREEEQKTARSITRNGAGKPIRAPKVSRVKGEDEAKAAIIEEAKRVIPQEELTPEEADKRAKRMSNAAINWLDELLINMAEHETSEAVKPTPAPATATPTATQPQPQAKPQPQPQAQPLPQPKPQQAPDAAPQTAAQEEPKETTAQPPESND
jgi:DivIVA domain-containing protein